MRIHTVLGSSLVGACLWGQVPDSIVTDGVPALAPELKAEVRRYLEFRTAVLQDWHPTERSALITTRFADASQLHLVKAPGGARRQLTFLPEPVSGGAFRPRTGEVVVYSQDSGGGEFYQLYRLDLADGRTTLLTDGRSRNTGALWSHSGRWLAYASTRRNGRDNDLYVMNPDEPGSARCVQQVSGGGWVVADWSADDRRCLVLEYVSVNESRVHLLDVESGEMRRVSGSAPGPVAYGRAQFAADGRTAFVASDRDSEFMRLVRLDLRDGSERPLTAGLAWDVENFDLSPDGRLIAFLTNEDGESRLHLLDTRTGRERRAPVLPRGVVAGLKWHPQGRWLGLTLSSARSPSDVYAVDTRRGTVERWTESETGGLVAARLVEPERVRVKSFDSLEISGLLYRPDPGRFPGKRPVIVNLHGGPESQSRPGFLARNNYYLDTLGIALLFPNVRGSTGYGKRFVTLDNGFLREDSVRDVGAFLDWIARDPGLEPGQVAVMGGSYGGYMVLASLVHHGDRLRCGVDVVGISNFLTFLKNTQDYRRDLRRVEYGDERDERMREFLGRISPTAQVSRMRRPLLVVQGRNDPRVPATESEQMVRALREQGNTVWYVEAKDEGHGFAKKPNADYQFLVTARFLQEHLLAGGRP